MALSDYMSQISCTQTRNSGDHIAQSNNAKYVFFDFEICRSYDRAS